jgi:hypothetical protein
MLNTIHLYNVRPFENVLVLLIFWSIRARGSSNANSPDTYV